MRCCVSRIERTMRKETKIEKKRENPLGSKTLCFRQSQSKLKQTHTYIGKETFTHNMQSTKIEGGFLF